MGNGHAASVHTGSRDDMGRMSPGGLAARKTAEPPIPARSTTAAAMAAIRLLMIALPERLRDDSPSLPRPPNPSPASGGGKGGGHLASPTSALACAHHQLGFRSGGYTGTAGTKPLRFGISTFGRLWASITSVSPMMPFRNNRNAVTA